MCLCWYVRARACAFLCLYVGRYAGVRVLVRVPFRACVPEAAIPRVSPAGEDDLEREEAELQIKHHGTDYMR